MKKSGDKIRTEFAIALLSLFFLIAIIVAFSETHVEMVGPLNGERLLGTKALTEIYTRALQYRLAEMEYVLSSQKGKRSEYEKMMESVLRQMARKQREYEALLSSQEEKEAYEEFSAEWGAYLNQSKNTIALSKKNLHQQATAGLTQDSRALFEKSKRSLGMVVELNRKYANSWSGFIKKLFRKNRVTLSFLYICGVTALFVLIFNLYDKSKRLRRSNTR